MASCVSSTMPLHNTLTPRQNGRHFTANVFRCIFLNGNIRILIEIWLKFVPKCSVNSIPALVQIMAWCRLGDKPLSEPMMVRLLKHICATLPQWIKPVMSYCHRDPQGQTYRQISNISRTKSPNLNASCRIFHLSLRNLLKPGVKWRMKM